MRARIIVVIAALLAGGALTGCSGSGDSLTSSPTPTAGVKSSALVPVPAGSLREVDFSGPPFDLDLMTRAGGGQVPRERIRYADLTGDGVEEAIVIVESGGTLGDIGVGVFRAQGAGIGLAYFSKLGGRVDIRGTALVLIEGAPAPGDAACCPAQLKETTVEWRGAAFQVTSERLITNPTSSGGAPGY
jgi:hypothetical protein